MIRVTVELVPFGVEEEARVIGSMLIANDNTGTPSFGNYVAVFKSDTTATQEVTVFNHPRSEGVWELVHRTLKCRIVTGEPRKSLRDYLVKLLKVPNK